MAHAKLNLNITPEWVKARAEREPESGIISAGGLADRLDTLRGSAAPHDTNRQSLAKFVELSRRKLRLSVEDLAERAQVDLADLLAIERAEPFEADPRTFYNLARVLKVKEEPLMELAGLITIRNSRMNELAVRFAARSEPMDALSPQEEEVLSWFLKEMSKG